MIKILAERQLLEKKMKKKNCGIQKSAGKSRVGKYHVLIVQKNQISWKYETKQHYQDIL